MTTENLLKITIDESAEESSSVKLADLKTLVRVVNQNADLTVKVLNQHSYLFEKLMQEVEVLEKSIEELRQKED